MGERVVVRVPGTTATSGSGSDSSSSAMGIWTSYDPPGAKAQPQRIFDQTDCGRVKSALRLADDEVAAEQLEMLSGLEDPQIDQAIVFDAGPASHALG